MAIYLYTRVSTLKQETGRQKQDITKKYNFDRIFEDKASGKSRENRPALKELLSITKAGDVVVASELSRLGRSLKDCIEIFEELVKKDVQVIADKEGIDSKTPTYKLLLGIFGAVAEMEREQTVDRIKQSADYYKENGITPKGKEQWGRAKKTAEDLPKNFSKYYNQMINKEINKSEMARLLGVTRQGLYKWLKLYEESNSKAVTEVKKDSKPVVSKPKKKKKEVTPATKIENKIKSKFGVTTNDLDKLEIEDTETELTYYFKLNGEKYQVIYLKNTKEIEVYELPEFEFKK